MYPINAASPERIAIGAVIQISDGAVQTSGVSIKVKPQGAAASAGAGTTTYEEGVVGYVPTQAETNYTSFQVIAYKAGCIPSAETVVTTASATAGYAALDWGVMIQKTATNALTNTSIASVSGAVGSVTGAVGSVVGLTVANLDVASSTLATAANLATVAGYLDTEIAAIKTKTDNLPAAPAAVSDIPTASTNASTLLATAVDGATTVAESMRLKNSAMGGKASGLATTTAVYRDLADTKDRIIATVDADGNRTAVTLDLA